MRARAILLAVAMLSGCSGLTVRDEFDHGTSFAGYRSFAWIAAKPLLIASAMPVNPKLEGYLMRSAKETLQSKGYEFVDDPSRADFLLGFRIGTAGLDASQYPEPYRSLAVAQGGILPSAPGIANELWVDIYDVKTRTAVWRGSAQKDVTGRDQAHAEYVIRHVVEAVLARFPPH